MNIEERIEEFVAGARDEIRAFLCGLIAIPTVNPPGQSYKECAHFFAERMQQWGIEHRTLTIPHETHTRFIVIGSYGDDSPGIHFHGHYDVVAPQSPTQFEPQESGGRLYGRGSSDMKGGIAAMLWAIRTLQQCGIRPRRKITFSLVPDEETGGRLGMRYLALEGLLPREGLGMLMPEPTSGAVWHASRGALTLRVRLVGKPAHVGLTHQGVNAFEQMAALTGSLVRLKHRIEARKTSLRIHPPEAASSVMLIGGESGGCANFNVVPDHAHFTIDRRLNPEETLDAAKRELERVFDRHRKRGARIEVETLQEGEPSITPEESPLAGILRRAIAEVTRRDAPFELCPGILETRFFSNAGVPGYAYGPGILDVSHGPEEYVALSSVFDCTRIYALTALRLIGR